MPAFDPQPLLDLARELADGTPSETKSRAAVGRAYYAALILARDTLNVSATEGIHAEVIYQVSRRYGMVVADKLRDLRELRVQADYRYPADENYLDWQANWTTANRLSGQLIEKLQTRRR